MKTIFNEYEKNSNFYILLLIKSLPILLFPFSPFLTLVLIAFSIVFIDELFLKHEKILYFLLFVISLTFVLSSKNFLYEMEFDLSVYYDVFLDLKKSDFESSRMFGGGIEIGWPALYFFISLIFEDVSIFNIAQINTFFVLFAIYIWYIKEFGFNQSWRFFVLMAFVSYVTLGFLQRQAIATVFLFFALYYKDFKFKYIFLFFSIIFHTSSVIIYAVFLILSKFKINLINSIIFFVILVFLRFNFIFIIEFVSSNFDFFGVDKLLYYLSDNFNQNEFKISSLRYTLLVFLMFFICINNKKNSDIKNMVFYASIFYISFIGFPLISDRVCFIFLIFYGYYLINLTDKKYYVYIRIFSFFWFLMYFLEKSYFFQKDDFLWSRIDFISYIPFNYIN